MGLFKRSSIDVSCIEDAIARLESKTSAELRVYIEDKSSLLLSFKKITIVERAVQVFNKLAMDKTQQSNAILIYVALKQKQCAVIGDKGFAQYVDQTYWQNCCDMIISEAKQTSVEQGIANCIDAMSKKMAEHFPIQDGDINELSNTVIIDDSATKK